MSNKEEEENMVNDEFSARFFSHDCSDRFDNSLSKFTTEFETALDFGDKNYECGVSHIYLNPTLNSETLYHLSRDHINLPHNPTKKDFTLDEFVSFSVDHSTSPQIFDRGYFAKYLDKNYFYEPSRMDRDFAIDKTTAQEDKDYGTSEVVTITLNIEDLMVPCERLDSFLLSHEISTEAFNKLKKIELLTYVDRPTTMSKLLNRLIRFLIYVLRACDQAEVNPGIHSHAKLFFNAFESYGTFAKLNEMRRKHLHKINDLVHRFIEHFISLAVENVKKLKLESMRPLSKFCFLYCSVIEPQVVGPITSKLLFVTPCDGRYLTTTHEVVSKINYCKLETRKIKTITFMICDEFGEQINFNPSYMSNSIVLKFRKIKAGI